VSSVRSSFACDGGGTWYFYERGGINIPMAEIRRHANTIAATEGSIARDDFLAMIRLKIRKAAMGELVPPGDVKARMARSHEINELRWRLRGTQWRLYYSEPLRLRAARVMLGLRFNHKISVEQQDRDIDEASRRNAWWRANMTEYYRV
jgi:hypothetical protein